MSDQWQPISTYHSADKFVKVQHILCGHSEGKWIRMGRYYPEMKRPSLQTGSGGMISLSAFPLCAARLKFQRCDLNDDAFTKYWAAVNVVSDLDDDELTEFGGFDFSDRSDENGDRLLKRIELFIRTKVGSGKRAKTDVGTMSSAESSVRAFLGANGVKVSKLDGIDDYWKAARILWGGLIEKSPKTKDVYTLVFQLNRIPKKTRPKMARQNKVNLPENWRAA